MDAESEYSKQYPKMAGFIQSSSPSGTEEKFRRAFNEANIGLFVEALDKAMANLETDPLGTLNAVKEVLGQAFVAIIQVGRVVDGVLAPFGKYEGPADLKSKWQLARRSVDPPLDADRPQAIFPMFDSIVDAIAAVDANADVADSKTATSVSQADVRLVANLVMTIGSYFFESRGFELNKIPF